MESAWTPHGFNLILLFNILSIIHMESMWNESMWILHGFHVESIWNPCRFHVESMDSTWIPHGINLFHMDSMWNVGAW
jgi:hypothetical protein